MSPREFADAMNNLSPEQIMQAMEKLPTDALEFAVRFECTGKPEDDFDGCEPDFDEDPEDLDQ